MTEIDLLLVGGNKDFNMHHLQKMADRHKISYHTCYTGAAAIPNITLDIHHNVLKAAGHVLKPKAIFIRPDVMTYQETKNPMHHRLASDWFDIFLGWSMANEDIKILNRNYYIRNKVNKVANLLIARQLGIPVAETYYTNDIYFMQKHDDGNWIEKPVHGGEHTKVLDVGSKTHFGTGVSIETITLQAKMVKPEYRFFRVGNSYRAFTMDSPSLDYRENQDATVKPVDFPEGHKDKFEKMTDILGLDFAAADYITNPETGELSFLEVNSGPMFTAFDLAADGALSKDMFDFLLGE
jgi:glutathione synthase/RimK-type ligase-like ATP-grasp enzyme